MYITGFLTHELLVTDAHSHDETLLDRMETVQSCGTKVTSGLILDQLSSVWIPQTQKMLHLRLVF